MLGSATPDIVTYHQSEIGHLGRVDLQQRVSPDGEGGTRPGMMPEITVVDMRDELRRGNRSVFSVPLARAVRAALRAGEQTILRAEPRLEARCRVGPAGHHGASRD